MANREHLCRSCLRAAALAGALLAPAASAELFFASFHSYEPIAAFEFEPGAPAPAVGIVYVRSSVGGRFTDIRVSIPDPDFRVTAHTCPTMLENGSSCMIYLTFDPQREDGDVYLAELEVISREGVARLPLSTQRSGDSLLNRRKTAPDGGNSKR